MNCKNSIEQLSEQIDVTLEKESKTGEFVLQKLKQYSFEILHYSYSKAREKLDVNLGEGIVELGLLLFGAAISNDELIDITTQRDVKRGLSQEDLDKRWSNASQKIGSCSTEELLQILYIDRKYNFEQTLSSLLRIV